MNQLGTRGSPAPYRWLDKCPACRRRFETNCEDYRFGVLEWFEKSVMRCVCSKCGYEWFEVPAFVPPVPVDVSTIVHPGSRPGIEDSQEIEIAKAKAAPWADRGFFDPVNIIVGFLIAIGILAPSLTLAFLIEHGHSIHTPLGGCLVIGTVFVSSASLFTANRIGRKP